MDPIDVYQSQIPDAPCMEYLPIWVFPKIGGKPPKMDGENNGKPY